MRTKDSVWDGRGGGEIESEDGVGMRWECKVLVDAIGMDDESPSSAEKGEEEKGDVGGGAEGEMENAAARSVLAFSW